jgi:ketosteroid isomerase-like protein
MRKPTVFLAALFAAFTLLPAPASALPSLAPNDKSQINTLIEKYRLAFEARDVNAIMSAYAPGDGVFVFDAIPPRDYPTWDEYRKDWEGLFKTFPGPVKDKISDLTLVVDGSMAYSHRIEDTHFTAADGTEKEMVTRVTDVYRKISGKWLIVHEHVSFPVDPTTGQADMLSKP